MRCVSKRYSPAPERLRADGKLTVDDSAIQRVVRTLTR